MTSGMRKICYVIIALQLAFVSLASAVLSQPFSYDEFSGTVTAQYELNTVQLETPRGMLIYPNVPGKVFQQATEYTRVNFYCNRGKWIPVLFDCLIVVPVHKINPIAKEQL